MNLCLACQCCELWKESEIICGRSFPEPGERTEMGTAESPALSDVNLPHLTGSSFHEALRLSDPCSSQIDSYRLIHHRFLVPDP